MKTRHGFVSNSSSSSFVVAFKKDKAHCEHCGRSAYPLLEAIEHANDYNDDNVVNAVGEEGVIYFIESQYYDETAKEAVPIVEEFARDKTWKLAHISMSYHSNLRTLLEKMEEAGDAVVVHRFD